MANLAYEFGLIDSLEGCCDDFITWGQNNFNRLLSCLSLPAFNACYTVDRRCALSLLRFLSISDTLLRDGAVPSGSLLELGRITVYMGFELFIDLLVVFEIVRKDFLKTAFRH